MQRSVILLYIMLFSSGCSSQSEYHSRTINIVKDSIHKTTVIALQVNGVNVDSLKMRNIDFAFDSLNKINDSLYHYIYSERWGNFALKKQILLSLGKDELSIPYFGRYEQDYRAKKESDLTRDGVFNLLKYRIRLDSIEDNILIATYNETSFQRYENEESYDTISSISYLRYDSLTGIFYTSKKIFDGTFKYLFRNDTIHNSFISVEFDNQIIPFIEVGYSKYFYYNGYWFYRFGIENVFTSDRELNLSEFGSWQYSKIEKPSFEPAYGTADSWDIREESVK